MEGEAMSFREMLAAGILASTVACGLGFALGVFATVREPLTAAQPGYLIRRVELKLVDHRQDPDATINPSYMIPNMRFVCTEEKKP
jgi:hypothetical protein